MVPSFLLYGAFFDKDKKYPGHHPKGYTNANSKKNREIRD